MSPKSLKPTWPSLVGRPRAGKSTLERLGHFHGKALRFLFLVALGVYLLWTVPARGGIQHTKHNLSSSSPNTIKGAANEICVYCHTPHQANPAQPLWNHTLSTATYTLYTSTSLNASLNQPNGYSRLCLSCHDGTVSIGSVYNVPGSGLGSSAIGMQGTTAEGKMPPGIDSGGSFSRNLGTVLTNDHPISFVFNSTVSNADGELVNPANLTGIIRLYPGSDAGIRDSVQCTSCHDPHNSGLPRFVKKSPLGQNDNLCITCHVRPGEVGKGAWQGSIHQSSPLIPIINGQSWGDTVANTACTNCHYPHNQGPPRLLRDSQNATNPGIEQTCYRCHTFDNRNNIPDIRTEWNKTYKMPIDRPSHVILDSNLFENINANRDDTTKRHVECPDCHNPHRVMKNSKYDGSGSVQRTHNHSAPHANTASGALKGMWGVDPNFGSAWTQPTSFTEHKTYPNDLVTMEYQVCLKCHSYYGFGNSFPTPLASPSNGVNGLTQLTDQAKEFNPNNSGFHPAVQQTGKTLAVRGISTNPWFTPFTSVGTQTMFCTDCHGASTINPGTVNQDYTSPTSPIPWGPHGSENPFILKGVWSCKVGSNNQGNNLPTDLSEPNALCFKCHSMSVYASRNGTSNATGFFDAFNGKGNLHAYHSDKLGSLRCMWCHVSVPHGYKNKALLVDLDTNDDGVEDPDPPYIQNTGPARAFLKVITWATSGQWNRDYCGVNSSNRGIDWMKNSCQPAVNTHLNNYAECR